MSFKNSSSSAGQNVTNEKGIRAPAPGKKGGIGRLSEARTPVPHGGKLSLWQLGMAEGRQSPSSSFTCVQCIPWFFLRLPACVFNAASHKIKDLRSLFVRHPRPVFSSVPMAIRPTLAYIQAGPMITAFQTKTDHRGERCLAKSDTSASGVVYIYGFDVAYEMKREPVVRIAGSKG